MKMLNYKNYYHAHVLFLIDLHEEKKSKTKYETVAVTFPVFMNILKLVNFDFFFFIHKIKILKFL